MPVCLVIGMVYLSNKNIAANEQTGTNSEVYTTAGRTISAGLTAADVVSKWTLAVPFSSRPMWVRGTL